MQPDETLVSNNGSPPDSDSNPDSGINELPVLHVPLEQRRELVGRLIRVLIGGAPLTAERPEIVECLQKIEAGVVDPKGLGNRFKRTVSGTLLTPDQDAIEMDATIPKSPESERKGADDGKSQKVRGAEASPSSQKTD